MPNKPTLTEVSLHPESNGLGKKCYAVAEVTKETGEFPNKRYFTSNRLRYIGLHTRTEHTDNSTRWYFQHPHTQNELYVELNSPFRSFNDDAMTPPKKKGFVEVVCHGNKIRSLQDLSRETFQTYIKSQSINDQHDFADSLQDKNKELYYLQDMIYPSVPVKNVVAQGGKRKKTIKKRRKRKSRKNRRKTSRQ